LKQIDFSSLHRLALCQAQDDELLKETYNITLNGARDQDVMYFFVGLAGNKKSKMELIAFFKKNYDGVAFKLIFFIARLTYLSSVVQTIPEHFHI
jgi:hypothetical protein